MANCITVFRILCSIALLIPAPFTPSFYVLYLLAGISDGIDGTVARLTHTASEFGAKLDSAADLLFFAVCLSKLLPVLIWKDWMIHWILLIAVIKVCTLLYGALRFRTFVSVHSALNKMTGAALFLLPLTIPYVDLSRSALFVCTIATAAALYESYTVIRSTEKNVIP